MNLGSGMLVVSLCTATIVGQTVAATPTPVGAPHIVLETVGPDGWRSRLGPTNLGSLLESEKARTLWQPRLLPLLGLWQQLLGDEAAYVASRTNLLGYSGRIRVGLWLNGTKQDPELLSQAAIVIEGDGRTDLAALAKDVRALQTRMAVHGEWHHRDVDGVKLDMCTSGGTEAMTAPIVAGNHLLIVFDANDRMAAAITAARTLAGDPTGKAPPPNTPALRLRLDLLALVMLAKERNDEAEWELMEALGLASLGDCEFTIGTAGPNVRLELAQQFRDGDRGLLAAFMPSTTGVPLLHHCVPAGPGSWKVGRFDFSALYAAVEKAVAAMREGSPEKMRAEAKAELGVDLVDDLLAHMTDEVLLCTSPLVEIERPTDVTWTLAVRLRDEAKFAASLATALQHSRPFLQREATEKVDDVEIHRYGNMFGYDVYMSVGCGCFVIAGGKDASAQITALLHAGKAMPKHADPATKVAAFEDLERHLPPGNNGMAQGDIDSVLALPGEFWLMLLGELMPLPDMDLQGQTEQREAARELLKQHGLGRVRTATGYHERTWRWRLFW